MAEMPESLPEDEGRKPIESGKGASSEAARREPVRPEESQLMEAVVARENMFRAYERVVSNKGAAGVDGMTVEQLKPYLQEHWAKIKEELLKGEYQPQPVRSVEIPKPQGGVRQLGIPIVRPYCTSIQSSLGFWFWVRRTDRSIRLDSVLIFSRSISHSPKNCLSVWALPNRLG